MSRSPLLDLSAELRNRIYELVLPTESEMTVSVNGRCTAPPLLLCCNKIRGEARNQWYSSNNFRFRMTWDHTKGPMTWIKFAPFVILKLIKSFTLVFTSYNYASELYRRASIDDGHVRLHRYCAAAGEKCARTIETLIGLGMPPSSIRFKTTPAVPRGWRSCPTPVQLARGVCQATKGALFTASPGVAALVRFGSDQDTDDPDAPQGWLEN